MKVGYINVSVVGQSPKLQHEALLQYGCSHLFTDLDVEDEHDQPELGRMLGHLKARDTVVVYKLEGMCHGRRRLFQVVDLLEAKDVGLVSIQDKLDSTTPGGMYSIREFLRWSLNESITPGTVIVFINLPGYGNIKIEECKTGIDDLDQMIEAGTKLTGCDPDEGYPGLDAAACLIDALGGEIIRVEYGPLLPFD
jgi:hypothetical protein